MCVWYNIFVGGEKVPTAFFDQGFKMTKFTKENLHKDGSYVFFATPENRWNHKEHRFVARFKVAGVGSFMTHLRKNWTVEAYFAAMEAGEGPLTIVKQTGYLLPHIKRWLKEAGHPATRAGYAAWKEERRARYAKMDAELIN